LELKSSFLDSIAPANFSLSVVDLDQVEDESDLQGTLFSHLLLSSDL
jgi:hypothetical protein